MIHFGIGRSITNLKLTRWSRLPACASMCGVNLGWRMRVSALPPLLVSGVIYRNASCSRRALRERSGLICVGGKKTPNTVICVINIIISAHFKPVKTTLVPHTCVYGSRAGIYNDAEAGLNPVEKVNGRARPSETRVNHPQKRQCLRCSPYIGVTTAPLLAWHSASAWEQLREPVAYMPDVSGCEATRGRKVRWKELIRSAAHKAPSPQWNVWTGHEFWRTSHNLTSKNNHQTANGYTAMAANKKTWAYMRVVMWGRSPERRFVCIWARCAMEALPAFLKRGTETGDEFFF